MVKGEFESILLDGYSAVGAFDASILYIYTDFRHFGTYAAGYAQKSDFCRAVIAPFLAREKTIVLAAFTYTTAGRFDVLGTPTRLGAINTWILKQPDVRRSEHPLYSYAALGPQADLVECVGKSAFGYDSVFDRLRNRNTAFLHVGRPVSMGNTALHHVEHMCGATYRVHKAFPTKVFRGEEYVGTDYSAFLRRRDVPGENFEFNYSKAAGKLHAEGIIKQVGTDDILNNISFYWYDQTIDRMMDMFCEDQRIFINSDFIGY